MRLLDLDTKLGTVINLTKTAYNVVKRTVTSSMSSPSIFGPVWTGEPTIEDVLKAQEILASISHLPVELIDLIIDYAEYWPHTVSFPHKASSISDADALITRSLPIGYPDASIVPPYPLTEEDFGSGVQRFFPPHPDMTSNYETTTPKILDTWTKYSMPRTRLKHPVRKIVFNIKSHDQGWGGNYAHKGTFNGSFTWFDAGIERLHGVDISALPESVKASQKIIKRNGRIETPSDSDNEHEFGQMSEASYMLPSSYLQFHNLGTTHRALKDWGSLRFDLEPVSPALPPRQEGQSYEAYRISARLKHPFLPSEAPDKTIQVNRTATQTWSEFEVVWRWDDAIDPESEEALEMAKEQGRGRATADGKFVRSLEVGDVVSVWSRARFPGWANIVERIEVKVYWAI